jgi:hypothetical protein
LLPVVERSEPNGLCRNGEGAFAAQSKIPEVGMQRGVFLIVIVGVVRFVIRLGRQLELAPHSDAIPVHR